MKLQRFHYTYTIGFGVYEQHEPALVKPEMNFKYKVETLAEAHEQLAKIGKPINWPNPQNKTYGYIGNLMFKIRRCKERCSPHELNLQIERQRRANIIDIGTRCLIDGEVYKVVSLAGDGLPVVEKVDPFVTPARQYFQLLAVLQATKIRTIADIRKALAPLFDDKIAVIQREALIVIRVKCSSHDAAHKAEKMAGRISDVLGVKARPSWEWKLTGKSKTPRSWAEVAFEADTLNPEP